MDYGRNENRVGGEGKDERMTMNFSDYLSQEWVPALGCTEPASIALAAARAASEAEGRVVRVALNVDPKIYKNCYAVGIPNSFHKTGILWAAAIGANLPDAELGLESFRAVTPEILERAGELIDSNGVEVEVDASLTELKIGCTVVRERGIGRAVIASDHTNFVLIERGGKTIFEKSASLVSDKSTLRKEIAEMEISGLVALARSIGREDRRRLREGIALNVRIAEHGLTLLPRRFVDLAADEELTKISKLVCAGVYARMCGEDFPVMSLAGSGNKGIVTSVPTAMHGNNAGAGDRKTEEALALACLVTSATTHHLGSLSAVCGCSNAAGIGLAAGLVLMGGGGPQEIGLAINNMVGNVTGMICDGAKIGCALKTMTAVDAAFRASSLALDGLGIPVSDGIVGESGPASLKNLGRIANLGMLSTDAEILSIMNEKLKARHGRP